MQQHEETGTKDQIKNSSNPAQQINSLPLHKTVQELQEFSFPNTCKLYRCVNCNQGNYESQSNECVMCSKMVDSYQYFDIRIIVLSLILGNTKAYRHIVCNRFINKQQQLMIFTLIGIIIIEVLFKLYNMDKVPFFFYFESKHIANKTPIQDILHHYFRLPTYVTKCNYPDSALDITVFMLKSIFSIILFLTKDLACIVLFVKLFYAGQIKKRGLNLLDILTWIIVSQFMRITKLLFIIWKHKEIYLLLAQISLKFCEIAVVRSMFESDQKQQSLPLITIWLATLTNYLLDILITGEDKLMQIINWLINSLFDLL